MSVQRQPIDFIRGPTVVTVDTSAETAKLSHSRAKLSHSRSVRLTSGRIIGTGADAVAHKSHAPHNLAAMNGTLS
jgi:hypothetical protein